MALYTTSRGPLPAERYESIVGHKHFFHLSIAQSKPMAAGRRQGSELGQIKRQPGAEMSMFA